jgi:hypothetical protein
MSINIGLVSQLINSIEKEISELERNKNSGKMVDFNQNKGKILELQKKIKEELKK